MTGALPFKSVIGFVLFVKTTTDVKANVSVLLDTCTIINSHKYMYSRCLPNDLFHLIAH